MPLPTPLFIVQVLYLISPIGKGRDGDRENHLHLHSQLPWSGTRLNVEGLVVRPVVGSHDVEILPWAPRVLRAS